MNAEEKEHKTKERRAKNPRPLGWTRQSRIERKVESLKSWRFLKSSKVGGYVSAQIKQAFASKKKFSL